VTRHRRTTPGDRERAAVQAELREALHDLSDTLLEPTYDRARLLDAIRHVGFLADLAEARTGLLQMALRNLRWDLQGNGTVDRTYFAALVSRAADQL
jgi:hypothetical protein